MAQPVPAPLMHLPDPHLSLFQSALAVVEQRARSGQDPSLPPGTLPPVDHSSPLLQGLAAAATLTTAAPASATAALRRGTASGIVETCAQRYLALARAEARGDPTEIAAERAKLPRFGACDDRWIKALDEFMLHVALRRHSDVPYRAWQDLADFVIPDPRVPDAAPILPGKGRVAIIGDWGTGDARAQALLRAVASFQPDVLVHLGDIYYSGSLAECDAFHANVRSVFPDTRVFTLCGNHDMYSGAVPYYALLNRLGQPASFFCLRNDHWQLLAMDTGYNDYDPFTENRTMTWLRDGTDAGGAEIDEISEIEWLTDNVSNAGRRKTVLLSHHPLFTRHTPIAVDQVCNNRLLAQVQPLLSQVDLWLWGHEHCQTIYAPFAGLARGRCVGASAIPTLPSEQPYEIATTFAPGQAPPDLLDDPAARLGLDPTTGWHDLGFGLLTLDGAAAEMTFYGFNEVDGPRVLHTDKLA